MNVSDWLSSSSYLYDWPSLTLTLRRDQLQVNSVQGHFEEVKNVWRSMASGELVTPRDPAAAAERKFAASFLSCHKKGPLRRYCLVILEGRRCPRGPEAENSRAILDLV